MRPLETLLSLANLLSFLALAVPQLRAVRWTGYLVLLTLLIAIAQGVLEGYRPQMILAYMLTGFFLLVWLSSSIVPIARPAHPLSTGLIGLGILGLAVSIALPLILPVFRFPRPSGPYDIGTLTYHWVDTKRQEIFSSDPKTPRELMVQIWYPAKPDPASVHAPYLQDADTVTAALAQVQKKPAFLFANLKYVTTHAVPFAPLADSEPSHPVLLFLEGATGFRQMNTFQAEELVSHDYVVVALDQPGTAAVVVFPNEHRATPPPLEQLQPLIRASYNPAYPAQTLNGRALEDGSIIPYLAQDVSFTLDQLAALNRSDPNGILTGRLDMNRVGAFGMSLGGIVVAEACRREPRLRACLMMDSPMPLDVVRTGLKQPSMWITRPAEDMRLERARAGGWSEDEIRLHQSSMRTVFKELTGPGYFVQIPGTFHINFTDVALWSPLLPRLGLSGPIDAGWAHRIINAYSLAFFDRHLRSRPAALLDGPSAQYPEVSLETRR